MSYNKVILMGRITHDLELRTTPNGISVCHFQMAVDRRFQTKGEERKADFFRVTAWRQTAEFITRYFRKGSMILVDGELQTSTYTDKSGATVNAVEVVVDQACFTGEKASNSQGGMNSYGNAGGYQGGNAGGYQSGNAGGYQGGYAGGYQGGNAGGYQGGYQQPAPQQNPANPAPPANPASPANNTNNGNGSDGVPGDFKNANGDTYPF